MVAAVFSASAANTVSTLSCGGWPPESAVVALALAIQQQIYINTCTEEDETPPCLVLVVVAAFGRRRAPPRTAAADSVVAGTATATNFVDRHTGARKVPLGCATK